MALAVPNRRKRGEGHRVLLYAILRAMHGEKGTLSLKQGDCQNFPGSRTALLRRWSSWQSHGKVRLPIVVGMSHGHLAALICKGSTV
jgi:hypothetical protein